MAQQDPEGCQYLAVVSEWAPTTPRGGLVGNAYPILNLNTGEVVDQPQEEFANAGAVFLTYRGSLNTWDIVILVPRWNDRFDNSRNRDCSYIADRTPLLLSNPNPVANIAVVLDHPAFDPTSANRQLLNPRHNVTPLFFVQKNQTIVGPLIRDNTHLSPMDDMQRIDWRPVRDDGIIYEFTRKELEEEGFLLSEYSHPEKSLSRVISSPIRLAVGPVSKAKSGKPLDALSDMNLIDWYLQRCPTVDIPSQSLLSLKAAFRGKPSDDPVIQAARLQKIDREMATHTAFLEQREQFAKRYVESASGQQRVRELIEQTVAKKASEIQAEVDKRQSQLAAKRDELDKQLLEAEKEHQELLGGLQRERDQVQEKVNELQSAVAQLQSSLSGDAKQLAARMQEQLPLFAALTAARLDPCVPPQMVSSGTLQPARQVRQEYRPIQPSSAIGLVETETKLVDDLHTELAHRGLHFSRDFVANVYTCLKAEPLNLIIGPPGYGKSMLVATLARSLGHSNAFLRIAVRRSWSEDRYLLGFFDSFHGRYDPGSTNLVPRMIQADMDWRQGRQGVYIVLLDEFNLSAPEYYFSQLLQALPSDAPVREIDLYDGNSAGDGGFPCQLTLNPNLRFWGTINYDETTERLSPRTLDRTGMIFLGDADVKPTIDEEPASMPGVAASDLFERFLRGADECPEDRWDIVSQVVDILRSPDPSLGPRVELSPRVRRAIKRYLANSVDVLVPRTAVDFVVQQRILPVLRGRGDEFFARMSRLGQLLSNASLSRSASHVEEALRRSEQQFGDLDLLSY